ncbi:MAG: dephospho-CoA kinase [Pseudomonadota bacterium]
MIVLGLTGSIGMGKSTTAEMFRDEGMQVWDADEAVHRLYQPGGEGAKAIGQLCPEASSEHGVDRSKLREAILRDPALLRKIEEVIHPFVSADRSEFLEKARAERAPAALCDIPLLFETGADRWLDRIVVVSAPAEVQRERVMARPGMTEEAFLAILAKQTPDAEKRERADYVIDTSQGLDHARGQVRKILEELNA